MHMFHLWQRQGCFCSLPCPDQPLVSQNLSSCRYHGFLSWGQSSQSMKMTTHLHLVLSSRMHGALLSLTYMAHDVVLKYKYLYK
jgi:hypothetical protein